MRLGRTTKGCLAMVAILIAIPVLIVGVVGVRTWTPLQDADQSLRELEDSLGDAAVYTPSPNGEIKPERVHIFLELRRELVGACGDYTNVQRGFDAVASMESTTTVDGREVAVASRDLGVAALEITPYLAKYFERRNRALLEASMGLDEYSYIYAVAYHDQLLSDRTRAEIFSDGHTISPDASGRLLACLERQLAVAGPRESLESEIALLRAQPERLPWQDGVPPPLRRGLEEHRTELDELFCGATAGLEMERSPRRALWIAIK